MSGSALATLSRRFDVTSGVPQGSVLGPLLFLVYINDITENIACKMSIFADDMKVWNRIRCAEDCSTLQKDMSTLYRWSQVNELPFNPEKCKLLQLGRSRDYTYHLGAQPLMWTTLENDLGIK